MGASCLVCIAWQPLRHSLVAASACLQAGGCFSGSQQVHEARSARITPAQPQFHYARALTWLVVLLRALSAGERWVTGLVALGTASTLLPPLLDNLPRTQHLRQARPPLLLLPLRGEPA